MTNGRSFAEKEITPLLLAMDGVKPGARRLIEIAVPLFAERGYHGVSIRDLTSAAGINVASFYNHFKSKEQLLFEVSLAAHNTHQTLIRDALLGAGDDPSTQLREAIRANASFHGTFPTLAVAANAEMHALSPEHRDRVYSVRHDSARLIVAIIERGNALGAFDCPDPWMALSAIGGMCLRIAWWFRGDNNDAAGTLSSYAAETATWFPEGAYKIEDVAAAFADFALKIVAAKLPPGKPTP
jgi:AcrR family transcriptional regulator